jgi:hypothetical protein
MEQSSQPNTPPTGSNKLYGRGISKKMKTGGPTNPMAILKATKSGFKPGVNTKAADDAKAVPAKSTTVTQEAIMSSAKKLKTGGMVNSNSKVFALKSAGSKGVKSRVNPKAAASNTAKKPSKPRSKAPKKATPGRK